MDMYVERHRTDLWASFAGIVLLLVVLDESCAAPPADSTNPPKRGAQMTPQRSLSELIDTQQPAIDSIRQWVRDARNPVQILEVERAAGERALLALQVTSRSPLGAVALETGGLLIDRGWIRVLGGGSARLPRAIDEWNGLAKEGKHRLPGTLLVGDDVLGGFFALNGGGINGPLGHVFYFSPEALEWEDLSESYTEWLTGLLNGDLESFYEGLRWANWQRDVESLAGDRGINVFPFPSVEGEEIAKRKRSVVPMEELWSLHIK